MLSYRSLLAPNRKHLFLRSNRSRVTGALEKDRHGFQHRFDPPLSCHFSAYSTETAERSFPNRTLAKQNGIEFAAVLVRLDYSANCTSKRPAVLQTRGCQLCCPGTFRQESRGSTSTFHSASFIWPPSKSAIGYQK
jgi:hypothetical protein